MRMTEAGYKRLSNMMAILVICANGIGAMLTSLYFIVIHPDAGRHLGCNHEGFYLFYSHNCGDNDLLAGLAHFLPCILSGCTPGG